MPLDIESTQLANGKTEALYYVSHAELHKPAICLLKALLNARLTLD